MAKSKIASSQQKGDEERKPLTTSNTYDTYGVTESTNSITKSLLGDNMDTQHSKQNGSHVTSSMEGSRRHDKQTISDKKKKILLVTMAIMDMSGGIMFGMIGPFFPIVAKEKNASPFLSGIVFGSFEFTMIFAAPIMGNFIARIGVRYTYTAGIMLSGLCTVLFGFLYWLPDNWFIPMCVLVRVLQGTGFAAFVTSTYAILVSLYSDKMASVFGIIETMKGVGFMVGPVVGSGLYQAGGYIVPFVTLGTFVLLAGACVSCILPRYTEKIKSEVSVWSLFKIPMAVICGLVHAALAYMFANFDATFALHLEQFNLKPMYVGLLFFGVAAGYVVAAPIFGKITDTWPHLSYIFMLVGFTLCGCCIMLAGPVPFLPLPSDNLALLTTSLIGMGIFASTAVVTFTIIFSSAKTYDFPDNLDTYGKISGFVEGIYNTGAFIGPMVGGLAYQNLGWGWSFSICGFNYFFCIALLFILLLWQKLYKGIGFTSGLNGSENEVDKEKSISDALLSTEIQVSGSAQKENGGELTKGFEFSDKAKQQDSFRA